MTKMTKKIKIDFNQLGYENALNELSATASTYNKALNCFETITGKKEFIQLEVLEKYITDKTGFKNVMMSSTLLEVSDELKFLQDYLPTLNTDVLDISNGNAVVKESVKDELKEGFTTYLNIALVNDFNTLQAVCDAINRLENPNHSKFLTSNHLGKWKVNKIGLHNSSRF
jgi:hypothetical protein